MENNLDVDVQMVHSKKVCNVNIAGRSFQIVY